MKTKKEGIYKLNIKKVKTEGLLPVSTYKYVHLIGFRQYNQSYEIWHDLEWTCITFRF